MDERLEDKATFIGNAYPEEAVCYVELQYRMPERIPIQSLMMPVKGRYALNTESIAHYMAWDTMTREEAHEWVEAKAEQLEEGTE